MPPYCWQVLGTAEHVGILYNIGLRTRYVQVPKRLASIDQLVSLPERNIQALNTSRADEVVLRIVQHKGCGPACAAIGDECSSGVSMAGEIALLALSTADDADDAVRSLRRTEKLLIFRRPSLLYHPRTHRVVPGYCRHWQHGQQILRDDSS